MTLVTKRDSGSIHVSAASPVSTFVVDAGM
jgi:hypothetical protein